MANLNHIDEKDYQKSVALLGREPRTPFIVKTKCANGSPQTLEADPVFFEDNLWKPFPSFIWLVCPRLKALAADLEQHGLVRFYSQKLDTDADFREEFLKGQREIADYRLKMAEDLFDGPLPEHIVDILKNTTVAGSRDFRGVKCLHAHLAHYLAFGNNPIGEDVFKKIGPCKVEDNCGANLGGSAE